MSADLWVKLVLGVLTLIGVLAGGYWQFVYKPAKDAKATPYADAAESEAKAAFRQLHEQLGWYREQFEAQMRRADRQEKRLDQALQRIAALEQQVADAEQRHVTDQETIRVLRQRVADLVRELGNGRP